MSKKTLTQEEKDIIHQWWTAQDFAQRGNRSLIDQFKKNHPSEYALINGMYRKRTELKKDLSLFADLGLNVYWITLTFNNAKDINKVETKRKQAQDFLNSMCNFWIMVEEYGEDNNRYHIHGFIVFKYMYGFEDFTKWHSRQQIVLLNGSLINKKIKYLTNYSVKQLPRLRRSKNMCCLRNRKPRQQLKWCFPDLYKEKMKNIYQDLTFDAII